MVQLVVSIMIFVICAIGGKLAYDALFNDPEITSFEESKWRNREYLGIKFESPFELSETEVDLPKFIKPFVKYMNTYEYDSKALCLGVSRSENIEGLSVDIDGAVKGMMMSLDADDDVSGLDYEASPVYKHYLEGRKITGKIKMKGKNAVITAELFKSGSKLIQILWTNLDFPENREVGERIMQSIRIQL